MTIDTPAEQSSTHLMVFDFDETIINCNSDFYVNRVAVDGKIPKEILDKYADDQDWTDYMQQAFKYFATQSVQESDYRRCLKTMPLVEGMKELFALLKQGLPGHRFEVIIISDANTFFIEQALEAHGLKDIVRKVFSNPARFDNQAGCLKIERYHTQDWCTRSPRNMCKGHILKEYIAHREASTDGDRVKFGRIMYVGDGWNDLCPSLKLAPKDVVFPRHGYRLHQMITKKLEGADAIQAAIYPFHSGIDILDVIQKVV